VCSRVGRFRRFLADSPSTTIAVVAHGLFFREMMGTSGRPVLGNCATAEILL
jgi:hypothetical protein